MSTTTTAANLRRLAVAAVITGAAALGMTAMGDLATASAAPGEWDIGEYDRCMEEGWADEFDCCVFSGGVWDDKSDQCVAPPHGMEGGQQPLNPGTLGPGNENVPGTSAPPPPRVMVPIRPGEAVGLLS